MAATGFCAALDTWFYGLREHLIFTPEGRIAGMQQIAGNRHDVHGLYALLHSSFKGTLLADSAYWPKEKKRQELLAQGIEVHAETHSNWKHPQLSKRLRRKRDKVERRIALFDVQFHADRTLNRSLRHYRARRMTKALAHNCARHINLLNGHCSMESVAAFHAAA